MKYFTNVHTLDELKAQYRRLAMKHHPDMGGDTATMQAINREHDELFERLKAAHNAAADDNHKTTETAEEFREILYKLMQLDGLVIEVCGCWLWVSGDTKKHKEALKAAGLRWSKNKASWYWRHPEDRNSYYRSKSTMSDIRRKYGSQVFDAAGREDSGYHKIGATA